MVPIELENMDLSMHDDYQHHRFHTVLPIPTGISDVEGVCFVVGDMVSVHTGEYPKEMNGRIP